VRALAANLLRLVAIGTAVGIIGVMVIYGGWRFCYPYAQEWQARGEVRRLETRLGKLRRENRRLQQQAGLLATPEGVKVEAHRLGLLKPGERSLRFMTRPQSRDSVPPKPAPASGRPRSGPERVRDWGRRLLAPATKPQPAQPGAASPSDGGSQSGPHSRAGARQPRDRSSGAASPARQSAHAPKAIAPPSD